MLIGLNPLLNADVLYALRAMGHGDDLIIADTNFPSDSVARETVLGEVLRIDASECSPAEWGADSFHPSAPLPSGGQTLSTRGLPCIVGGGPFRTECAPP